VVPRDPPPTITTLRQRVLDVCFPGATHDASSVVLRLEPWEGAGPPEDGFEPAAYTPLADLGFVSGCKVYAYTIDHAAGAAAAAAAAPVYTADSTWPCPQCTLENKLSKSRCEVCNFSMTTEQFVLLFGEAVRPFVSAAARPSRPPSSAVMRFGKPLYSWQAELQPLAAITGRARRGGAGGAVASLHHDDVPQSPVAALGRQLSQLGVDAELQVWHSLLSRCCAVTVCLAMSSHRVSCDEQSPCVLRCTLQLR
jgi:hypothetical protein